RIEHGIDSLLAVQFECVFKLKTTFKLHIQHYIFVQERLSG
ncbi:hypothetical protein L915_11839, partial [Phytophthora nicotianae]